MQDWKPTEQGINALIQVLEHMKSPNTESQMKAYELSSKLQEHNEFAAYAGFVFCNNNLSKNIRIQAGLMLKNYIFRNKNEINDTIFKISRNYIANAILDPLKEIRRTASNVC